MSSRWSHSATGGGTPTKLIGACCRCYSKDARPTQTTTGHHHDQTTRQLNLGLNFLLSDLIFPSIVTSDPIGALVPYSIIQKAGRSLGCIFVLFPIAFQFDSLLTVASGTISGRFHLFLHRLPSLRQHRKPLKHCLGLNILKSSAMEFSEDNQNSAPGSIQAAKLSGSRKGPDSQSTTKRYVAVPNTKASEDSVNIAIQVAD